MSVNVDFDWIPFIELLSNIVDNRGKTCPTSDSGIPLIATNCISNETLFPKYEKIRYVSKETYDNWFRGHPIPGDLIFVTKGTPGRVNFTPNPVGFCIAQDMVAIRADEKIIYPKYLFAILRSQGIQRDIENMHVGTLIPHFKKGDFKNLLLPVPEMQHQKTIGDLYFLLSYKIELNRQMNETLESIARAIFTSWFINFDPVRAKAEGRQPEGMDAETAALFPSEFETVEGQEIPKGWSVSNIYEISDVVYGQPYSSKLFTSEQIGYPLIRIRDLKTNAPDYYTDEKLEGEILINPGDIIVGMDGEFRAYFWMGPISLLNQRLCKFVPKLGVSSFFVYESIKYPLSFFETSKVGTTVIHLGKGDIDTFKVVIPSKEILLVFGSMSNNILKSIISNSQENRSLTNIRDTLLPKLLSGELPITNPEQFTSVS